MEAREHPVTLYAAGIPRPFIAWRNGEHGDKRTTKSARRAFVRAFHPMDKGQHLAARDNALKGLQIARASVNGMRQVACDTYGQGLPFGSVRETTPYPAGTWKHWPDEARQQIYAAQMIVQAWQQLAQEHHLAAGKQLATFRLLIQNNA